MKYLLSASNVISNNMKCYEEYFFTSAATESCFEKFHKIYSKTFMKVSFLTETADIILQYV